MIYKPESSLIQFQESSDSEIVSLDKRFYRVPKFNAGDTEVLKTVSDNAELNQFFNELVTEAARIVNIPIEYFEKDWLAQLLTRFHQRKEFLDMVNLDGTIDEKDEAGYRYLVDMAVQAMKTRESAARAIRLLRLGDQALFSVGFFPERIERHMGKEGLNYYENMSRTSYSQAADVMNAGFIKKVAYQVGNFRKIVRCLCTALKKDRQPYVQLMRECGQAQSVMGN